MLGHVKRDLAGFELCLSFQLNNRRVCASVYLAHAPVDMINNPLHNVHIIITVLVLKVHINSVPLPPAAAPPIPSLEVKRGLFVADAHTVELHPDKAASCRHPVVRNRLVVQPEDRCHRRVRAEELMEGARQDRA